LSAAGVPSTAARLAARTPVDDSPFHESGPMVRKSGGVGWVSPLTMAAAVRSLLK
jgi:hypothetical protein